MRRILISRTFFLAVILGGLFLAQGCWSRTGRLDERESRDPLLSRALAKEKEKDIDGAIELYNAALERKPALARAHLDIGLLYDKDREDYVRAIYHYQRYIELRPQSDKRKMIEDLIRQARLAYAASLPDRPSGAIDAIHSLKKVVVRLQAELDGCEGRAEPPRGAPSSTAGAATRPSEAPLDPTAPRPAPTQPQVDSYTVQRGDTLSRIASKMYNDPNKWQAIYDANRTSLGSPESLRMGQTLIIPRL